MNKNITIQESKNGVKIVCGTNVTVNINIDKMSLHQLTKLITILNGYWMHKFVKKTQQKNSHTCEPHL